MVLVEVPNFSSLHSYYFLFISGCAFVTFSNRQVAMVAIKAMHHSVTMEGCSSTLVVKFADTQEQKKVQQIQTNLWGLASPGVRLLTIATFIALALAQMTVSPVHKVCFRNYSQNDILSFHQWTGGGPYVDEFLFNETQENVDEAVRKFLLAISLCMLCSCLIGMVNILNSLFGTKVKSVIENVINADIPIRGLGWLTRYLAMIVGALMTILVQSSSAFTSTMTPLAGASLTTLNMSHNSVTPLQHTHCVMDMLTLMDISYNKITHQTCGLCKILRPV